MGDRASSSGCDRGFSAAWPVEKSSSSVRSRITRPRSSIEVWICPERPCALAYASICCLDVLQVV